MSTFETTKSSAEQQARAQYGSICLLLEAIDYGYSELEHLEDELQGYKDEQEDTDAEGIHAEDYAEITANIKRIEQEIKNNPKPFDDIDNEDDAVDRLLEDALEVQVRTGWHDFGDTENQTPSEFYILLCTGGPAVRIRGELDEHGQPSRAWLEYQDWGTPWTDLYIEESGDVLCRYASYYLGG
jgi:hypothetical protein